MSAVPQAEPTLPASEVMVTLHLIQLGEDVRVTLVLLMMPQLEATTTANDNTALL